MSIVYPFVRCWSGPGHQVPTRIARRPAGISRKFAVFVGNWRAFIWGVFAQSYAASGAIYRSQGSPQRCIVANHQSGRSASGFNRRSSTVVGAAAAVGTAAVGTAVIGKSTVVPRISVIGTVVSVPAIRRPPSPWVDKTKGRTPGVAKAKGRSPRIVETVRRTPAVGRAPVTVGGTTPCIGIASPTVRTAPTAVVPGLVVSPTGTAGSVPSIGIDPIRPIGIAASGRPAAGIVPAAGIRLVDVGVVNQWAGAPAGIPRRSPRIVVVVVVVRAGAAPIGIPRTGGWGYRARAVRFIFVGVVIGLVLFARQCARGNDVRRIGAGRINAVVVPNAFGRVAQTATHCEKCSKKGKNNVSHTQEGLPL